MGLALLLALDLNVAQWLDAVVKAEGEAKERIAEAARLVEEAETVLDYKYAVHDYLKLPRPDEDQEGTFRGGTIRFHDS